MGNYLHTLVLKKKTPHTGVDPGKLNERTQYWDKTLEQLKRFAIPSPFDSILDAVFTVSPNKQYLGIFRPTTPATQAPTKKYIQNLTSWCNIIGDYEDFIRRYYM